MNILMYNTWCFCVITTTHLENICKPEKKNYLFKFREKNPFVSDFHSSRYFNGIKHSLIFFFLLYVFHRKMFIKNLYGFLSQKIQSDFMSEVFKLLQNCWWNQGLTMAHFWRHRYGKDFVLMGDILRYICCVGWKKQNHTLKYVKKNFLTLTEY